MAIPVVASVGTLLTGANGSSAAIPVPSGVASGDLILVMLYLEADTTVTPPAGFTFIAGVDIGAGNHWVYSYWKRTTGADTGTYTFTFASTYRSGVALRITGEIASGDPIDASDRAGRASSGSTTPAVSVTTTGTDRLLVFFGSCFSFGAWTPPAGFTERVDAGTEITVATAGQAAAGASGSVTATSAGNNSQTGTLIAVTPVSSGTTGALAASMPAATASIAGTVTDPAVLATTMPTATAAMTGTVTTASSAAAVMPAASAALTGAVLAAGILDATMPSAVATLDGFAEGGERLTGGMPTAQASLTGTVTDPGTLAATMPTATAGAVGDVTTDGALAAGMPAARAAVGATVTASAVLGASMPAATAELVGNATAAGEHVSWWALNPDGTYDVALPDVVSWTISPVDGSPGVVDLRYPVDGRGYDTLRSQVTQDRDLQVAIWISGGDIGSLRAYLNTSDLDDVAESEVATFSGNLLPVRMEEALVFPRDTVVTPPTGPPPTTDLAAFRVYAATAGTVMATLQQEARTRGTHTDIVTAFTSTVDSLGTAWSKTSTLKFAPGTSHLKVLDTLTAAGMCEWDVVWNGQSQELVLWEPGTRGVDHTVKDSPLILRAGRDLTESPRKHSVRDAGTTLLLGGGEGLYQEFTDATATARRGRPIERFNSQGSYTDPGSLAAFGTAKLPTITAGVMEVGHGVAVTPGEPRPLVDYTVGDLVLSDTGAGLEPLRIAQLTVSGDQDGIVSAGLSLNDLIAGNLEALSRRVDGIEGGSVVTGTSNTPPDVVDNDTMAPSVPQGLVVNSAAYQDGAGNTFSSFTAAWGEVLTNADLTVIEDLAGYRVRWRYVLLAPADYREPPTTTATSLSFAGALPGESVGVQVSAFDTSGNQSGWSAEFQLVGQDDATPPPVPSAPVVTTHLGQLKVVWDGLGSVGEQMPPDLAFVEVHASATSNFTPDAATLADRLVGSRETILTGHPYGAAVFVRLVAVDRSGNTSGPSAQGSGTPAEIGFADLAFDNSGNLVEDGSFELAGSRATHLARSDPGWSMVQAAGADTADHGQWYARATGSVSSGFRTLVLSGRIPILAGEQLAYRFALRGTGVNGDLSARIRWYDKAGTAFQDNSVTYTPAVDGTGAWLAREAPAYTAPAAAESFQVVIELHDTCTAGTWDVDRVEVREMIGTLLIRNAAITNAKIANLDVGKLTSGSLTAIVAMLGMIRTAAPPNARVEIDAAGIRKYDAGNVLRVEITETQTFIDGRLVTGRPGESRIEVGNASEGRDSVFAYDVNGDFTTIIGQAYDQATGLPLSNGVLVSRDNPTRNLFKAYGSGSNVGVTINRPDNSSGTGTMALRVREGEDDLLRMTGQNGSAAYAGPLSGVGQGFYIADPGGAAVLSAREGEFYYHTAGGGVGSRIWSTPTYFHFGSVDAGSGVYGFDYFSNGFANSRCDVAQQVLDPSGTAFREIRASNVTFSSSAAAKEDFAALPAPALSVLRGAPAARWRYRGDRDGEPLHIGPVAEDLPEWAVQPPDPTPPINVRVVEHPPTVDDDGNPVPSPTTVEVPSELPNTARVSAMSMIGLLWDAVRELDAELDEYRAERGRPRPTRRRVADLLDDLREGRPGRAKP